MSDCVFCKIVKKEIPCALIYESENFISFLDIAPASEGHTLIVPKVHYKNLWDIPESLGTELLDLMKRIGDAILKATKATGLNVLMNNNSSAGQLVPHAHIHLIPRKEKDGLLKIDQKEYESKETMRNLAENIKAWLK